MSTLYPQNNASRTMLDLGGIWDFRFQGDEQWQTIAVPASYNDQDPATGNLHSQYGRIQFWSGIHHETDPRNEAGPHTRDEGGWRFRSDRQWDGLPRLHLWSPEYSSARVADLFEAFLRETREPPR